jgi:hypothetical protein
VLDFTTASGEADMCVIIFVAKKLDPLWVQGLAPGTGREESLKLTKTPIGVSAILKDQYEHSMVYVFPASVVFPTLVLLPLSY